MKECDMFRGAKHTRTPPAEQLFTCKLGKNPPTLANRPPTPGVSPKWVNWLFFVILWPVYTRDTMLWLSVANKDVYIIYCLLFTYSALIVTYLPPRGATVHAVNRKSVKIQEFPVPLYWVSLVYTIDGIVHSRSSTKR